MIPNSRIPVHIVALDPLSQVGLTAALRPRAEVLLVGSDGVDENTIGIAALDAMHEPGLELLGSLRQSGCRRVILVIASIADDDLIGAVEAGVCAVVRRDEATPERLTQLVLNVAAGGSILPG